MTATQNRLPFENVKRICAKAFPGKTYERAKELAGGLCNTVYLVTFSDQTDVILKIAAATNDGYLSNENDLMGTEVRAMQFMQNNAAIPVPKVLFYDTDRDVCNASYFFMEKADGENFAQVTYKISDEEKKEIYREIGETVLTIGKMKIPFLDLWVSRAIAQCIISSMHCFKI